MGLSLLVCSLHLASRFSEMTLLPLLHLTYLSEHGWSCSFTPDSPSKARHIHRCCACLLNTEQDQLPGSKQQATHRHRMRQESLWGTGPSFWDFILGARVLQAEGIFLQHRLTTCPSPFVSLNVNVFKMQPSGWTSQGTAGLWSGGGEPSASTCSAASSAAGGR